MRDRAQGKAVTTSLLNLVDYAVRISDNTAADALLRIVGKKETTAYIHGLGVAGVRIDRSETELARDLSSPAGVTRYATDPRDTVTPAAMVQLLTKLQHAQAGLSPEGQSLLFTMMTRSTTGAHRIRSILPAGAALAHKTGTMPGVANDAGIITTPQGQHIAIAILTKGRRSGTDDDIDRVIADIASVVYHDLSKEHV